MELELTLVAEGFLVPEGPVALSDGSVLLVEISRKTIVRVEPSGKVEVVAQLDGGPNGLAIGPDGALYICNNGGSFTFRTEGNISAVVPVPATHQGGSIQRLNLKTGEVTTLYTQAGGRRLESPNDLVFDRQGGFWFTDYGCMTSIGRNYGSICYALPDGSRVERVRQGLVSPNGIGLSPDGKLLYVADTSLGRLWSFDVTAPGQLGDPPPFQLGRVVRNLQGGQRVDSLAVEADGRICVATMDPGGIAIFEPDGSSVDFLELQDRFVTNICFGGADMRDAWITASGTGRLYKTRWPRPGLKLQCEA
jgi:gluconolactonase